MKQPGENFVVVLWAIGRYIVLVASMLKDCSGRLMYLDERLYCSWNQQQVEYVTSRILYFQKMGLNTIDSAETERYQLPENRLRSWPGTLA